jgi:hypothetical protein
MTWLELEAAMLDGARAAAGLCANWLFQSTLLIVGGLLIGYLLRRRGSAVQSAVYRTTLVAVLACPLATWGLSQLGVAGWSFEMPLSNLHQEVSTVPPPPAASAAPQAELESAMIDSLGPRTIEPPSDAAWRPIAPG